ncbi:nitroreductase family protein [Virgibacillus necropolis]|uniref:Nitroreductase family protein n=1 Tax=Virgibacillus necropolis TaxID=163877 RepID=A0A221MAY5_9BACI|nr:nitroreductase family protein [Virgibacillus necropolis]ASN04815.1 nitroreductase family protein [Virgibacillus necropolis]
MNNVKEVRTATHDIDPIYLQRWSPRSFQNKEVPENLLHGIFEAARWAPSAANMQPWHFVVARNDQDRAKFHSFIFDNNVEWCKNAPVLIAITSKMDSERFGDNVTHAFDTGAAWGYLALEATRKGLATHGMGGFDRDKAREVLQVPDNYAIQAIIALGYKGEKELLEEKFHEREKPSNRKEVDEFISEGMFTKE